MATTSSDIERLFSLTANLEAQWKAEAKMALACQYGDRRSERQAEILLELAVKWAAADHDLSRALRLQAAEPNLELVR